jgi:putative membrane protein
MSPRSLAAALLLAVTTAFSALIGTAVFPGPAVAATGTAAPVTAPLEFATQATIGNMFEIQSSELALKQSSNDKVRQFAQKMIDDHGKAAKQMQPAAATDGINLPTQLDAAHQAQLQQLSALSGDAFDKAYVSMQVDAHDQAVDLFRGFSEGGKGALKDFAAKTLPILEEHQKMIHSIAGK